jgi:hypothetical protein
MVVAPLSVLILDPQKYLLRDRENEKKWGISLEQTVAKARANNRKLLKDYQVYISTLASGHDALLRILEINGADARIISNTIKGRAKILRLDYLRSVGNRVLICTATSEDKVLRDKFREELKDAGLRGEVYSIEWIMMSVLRQEVEKGNKEAILT